MISVDIPEEDIPNFQKLLNLDDNQFNEVLGAIKNLQPTRLSPRELYSLLEKTSIEDAGGLTDTIFGLLFSFIKEEQKVQEDIVADLLYKSFIKKSGIAKDKEVVKTKLMAILSSATSVKVAYKVAVAKRGFGNYIKSQKVSIEVKPIFTGESEDNLIGNVLLHNLQFTYFNTGDDDEKIVSFTLDRDDLLELKRNIEILDKQGDVLIDKFSKAELPIIE